MISDNTLRVHQHHHHGCTCVLRRLPAAGLLTVGVVSCLGSHTNPEPTQESRLTSIELGRSLIAEIQSSLRSENETAPCRLGPVQQELHPDTVERVLGILPLDIVHVASSGNDKPIFVTTRNRVTGNQLNFHVNVRDGKCAGFEAYDVLE